MTVKGNGVPELELLLKKVEEHFNRRISTTTDFEVLSVVIEHECGEIISASTLKRLWGYVTNKSAPRQSTLDVLCHYIGVADFKTFCKELQLSGDRDSLYFSVKYISSQDISVNEKLRIGWRPNRLVELLYLGESRYRVVRNENSRLQVGDEFEVASFMFGHPLFIPMIYRGGAQVSSYIAGNQYGLTTMEQIGK